MADTVTLIFDPEFGDAIRAIADRDVWVIRSPTNAAVVDDLRRTGQRHLTTFENCMEPDTEAFDEMLRTIELHHGGYSRDPPFGRIEVYGLEFNEAFADSLRAVGFELRARTAKMFTAQRAITGL